MTSYVQKLNMLKKINKIKNLGIFQDYKWSDCISGSLPEFKKYNLIYGWNGCGKTTLSRFFSALGNNSSKLFPQLQYEIETNEGVHYNETPSGQKIRVFNKDYIKENVGLHNGKNAKSVYIVGKVDEDAANKIEKNQSMLEILTKSVKEKGKEKNSLEKQRDTLLKSTARTIEIEIKDDKRRFYQIDSIKKDILEFEINILQQGKEITDRQLALARSNKKEIKESIPEINIRIKSLNDIEEKSLSQWAAEINAKSKEICEKTIQTGITEKLRANPDISNWVEKGLGIHKRHKSKRCEFCNSELTEDTIEKISSYFNEEYKSLCKSIDLVVENLKKARDVLRFTEIPHKLNFFSTMQKDDYDRLKASIDKNLSALAESIAELMEILEDKKNKVNLPLNIGKILNTADVEISIEEFNNEIIDHNDRVKIAKNRIDVFNKEITNFHIQDIYKEYKENQKHIEKLTTEMQEINDGKGGTEERSIEEIKKEIQELRQSINSDENGCKELNKALHNFLGRKDIAFKPSEDEENPGYELIGCDGTPENLSEGEITAVALMHFITSFKDKDFKPEDSIIVIDDPISSFDENFIFQAFVLIRKNTRNVSQLFIMTHNFNFFKKITRSWFEYEGKNYYMLKPKYKEGHRLSYIDKIDEMLCKYDTEYQYMLRQLYDFTLRVSGNDSISIEEAYPLANATRKVMEAFLEFYIPNGKNNHKKIKEDLSEDSQENFDAVWSFVNDGSHDNGGNIDHIIVEKSKENIPRLFKAIKELDEKYFVNMMQGIGVDVSQGQYPF